MSPGVGGVGCEPNHRHEHEVSEFIGGTLDQPMAVYVSHRILINTEVKEPVVFPRKLPNAP